MCAAQQSFSCNAINTRIQYREKEEMNMFMEKIITSMDFMFDSIRDATLAHRTYEELARLTDGELSALGLSRSEIVHVAFSKLSRS